MMHREGETLTHSWLTLNTRELDAKSHYWVYLDLHVKNTKYKFLNEKLKILQSNEWTILNSSFKYFTSRFLLFEFVNK